MQEHWHFDCQLHKLNSVSSEFISQGKAVDTGDPILPLQMPRGYGGTAVLWKRGIDHLCVVLPDGGNRIQCVELRGMEPLLIISVYMPCKGLQGCVENYEDTLTKLNESSNAVTPIELSLVATPILLSQTIPRGPCYFNNS